MTDPLFHPSAIHILKLVSGLPKAARERQQILVLQAFIDDSHSKGEVLVLSGFIADALSWAKFSQEWQAMLDGLRMPAFKMSHLAYGGGDITTEHASWFYRIAETHARTSVTIAIREPLVARIMDEFMLPPFQANPYNIALPAIMKSLVLSDQLYGFKEPLEVIFDKQSGIEAPFLRAWDDFFETLSPREKQIFESRPRFERDERFLPLQAADLQAYWMRDYCKKGGKLKGMPNPYPWALKHVIQSIIIEPEEGQIRQIATSYRAQYVKQSRERGLADQSIPDEALDFRGSQAEWSK